MQFADATWENRNLNVKTCEISFGFEDCALTKENMKHFLEECLSHEYEYIVFKTQFIDERILYITKYFGFEYIENQIELSLDKNEYYKSKCFLNYENSSFSCHIVDDDRLFSTITKEIEKGIYKTDRISIDPYFGVSVSNRRYSNWANDIFLKSNGIAWLVCSKDIPIGYEIGIGRDNTFDMLLSGLFLSFQKRGIGKIWQKSFLNEIFNSYDVVKTTVSSNNIAVIKTRQCANFAINKIASVYIKHNQ